MIYPTKDFKTKWYIASHFGENRGSYIHNGVDINLKTGGDSDLGQPLLAIAKGKIVYYHQSSHPTRNYGIHNVLEIKGPWGTRWVHYCHNQSQISEIKEVEEGKKVALVGKSGTAVAHCHFAIFKVDPRTLPSGIDTIARNTIELNNCWEDPIKFIERWMINEPDPLQECLKQHGELVDEIVKLKEELDSEKKRNDSLKEENGKLNEALQDVRGQLGGCKTRAKELKEHNQEFVDKIAAKVGSIADESRILEKIDMDVTTLDNAQKKVVQLKKAITLLQTENNEKITDLTRRVDEQNGKLEQLIEQNKRLKGELETLKEDKQQTNRFVQWIKDILESFKK